MLMSVFALYNTNKTQVLYLSWKETFYRKSSKNDPKVLDVSSWLVEMTQFFMWFIGITKGIYGLQRLEAYRLNKSFIKSKNICRP